MKELAGRAIAHYDRAASWRRGGRGLAETPAIDIRAAWLHLVEGDTARSVDALRRVIDREGPADNWCADLARVMVLRGRRGEAIAYLEQTLDAQPEFDQVRDQLGRMLFEDGRTEDVVSMYRRAIDPTDHHHRRQASLRVRLASVYLALGRISEAADELRAAVELQPLDARTRLDLARVLMQQGHEEEAGREYEEALRLDPEIRESATR
jgi:tetratricopeptide (TPR) repeat protein